MLNHSISANSLSFKGSVLTTSLMRNGDNIKVFVPAAIATVTAAAAGISSLNKDSDNAANNDLNLLESTQGRDLVKTKAVTNPDATTKPKDCTYRTYNDRYKYREVEVPVRRYDITSAKTGNTRKCFVLRGGEFEKELIKILNSGEASKRIDLEGKPWYSIDFEAATAEIEAAALEVAKDKLRDLYEEYKDLSSTGYSLGSEYNSFGLRTPGTIHYPAYYEEKCDELEAEIKRIARAHNIRVGHIVPYGTHRL